VKRCWLRNNLKVSDHSHSRANANSIFPNNVGFPMLWCFTGFCNDILIIITHIRTFVGNLDRELDNLMTDLGSILSNASLLGKN